MHNIKPHFIWVISSPQKVSPQADQVVGTSYVDMSRTSFFVSSPFIVGSASSSLFPTLPFGFDLAQGHRLSLLTRHLLIELEDGGVLVERDLPVLIVPAGPIVETREILARLTG
jgi:hypothetical protein